MAIPPLSNAKKRKLFARALQQGESLLAEIFSEAVNDPNRQDQDPPSIAYHVEQNGHVRTYAEMSEMGARALRLYNGIHAITGDADETGRVLLALYQKRHPEVELPISDPAYPISYRIVFKQEDFAP